MNFNSLIEQQIKGDSEYNTSVTEKGALGYATTGKHILDMNFKISSYRNMSEQEIITDFIEVINENAELAVKFLFYIRDIRQGLGERRLFRVCFPIIINKVVDKDIINNLLLQVAEFGRFDDLVSFINNKFFTKYIDINKMIVKIINEQLAEDNIKCKNGEPISLISKWLPSLNTSSKETVKTAKWLCKELCLKEVQYRKLLAKLRKHIDVVEVKTSSNKWNEIKYENVPSKANLKYSKAFLKHDEERRREFLSNDEVQIKSSVTFPHEILHNLINGNDEQTMEKLWKNLPNVNIANTMVVADGSGSMTSKVNGTKIAALTIANALAIYFSERNSEPYKNTYITFSEKPQFVRFEENNTLLEKWRIAKKYNEIANTNIEAVFSLILITAIRNKCEQCDIPANVLIISDMEFDACVISNHQRNNVDEKLFQIIEKRYEENGYKLPRLIFWNLMSRSLTIPRIKKGTILMSGFSINTMKMAMSGEMDPYKALLDVLNSERYLKITLQQFS